MATPTEFVATYKAAKSLVRTLLRLKAVADYLAAPPAPQQVEAFHRLHLSLLQGIAALTGGLSSVLADLTETATANHPGPVSACGQSAANAHDLILRIADDVMLALLGALGAEPGTAEQRRLCEANREAVQRALAHLDREQLCRLEALARQEAILTGERGKTAQAAEEGGAEGLRSASAARHGAAHEPERLATPKAKRSTERGEGRVKLIAALTKHHRYADGACLNMDPIGNNALADLARVSISTASRLFKTEFKGHGRYRGSFRSNRSRLVAALKLLSQEFSPYHLLHGAPPTPS